jgi:hypothetical protein
MHVVEVAISFHLRHGERIMSSGLESLVDDVNMLGGLDTILGLKDLAGDIGVEDEGSVCQKVDTESTSSYIFGDSSGSIMIGTCI